jgi:peptidoglycan-associated lipoprotein
MVYLRILLLGMLASLLAGCPSSPAIPDPEPTDTIYGDSAASTDSMDNKDPYADGEYLDDPTAGELGMVIYFDFDSSEVRAADRDLVTRHAMRLGNDATVRVRLEGHADERGSREYNIGLGERRAQAVRQLLMIQGAGAAQIATVSFGEERPAAFGSSESDYAQNRRVEFKYTN